MSTSSRLRFGFPMLILASVLAAGAGRAAEEPGDLQRARAVLEAAVAADPANAELWLHLGFVDHKLHDLDAAERAFSKSASLAPERADAHYMLALIYEKKGERDRAVAAWQECLKAAKDSNMQDIAKKHLEQLKPPAKKS